MKFLRLFFIKRKIKKSMGKYGLKGETGLFKYGLINSNYDCNGHYFIYNRFKDEDGNDDYYWKRIPKDQYDESKHELISCHYCNEPAVTIDHSWDWMTGMTMCEKHYEDFEKENLKLIIVRGWINEIL